MKKTFLTGMLLASTMFASNTNRVVYDDDEPNAPHFTLSLQGQRITGEPLIKNTPRDSFIYVGAGLGYQTAINDDAYIQSYSCEAITSLHFTSKIVPSATTATATTTIVPAVEVAVSAVEPPAAKQVEEAAVVADTETSAKTEAPEATKESKTESAPASEQTLTNIHQTLKVSGIRYFDSTEENRLFVCGGPFATIKLDRDIKQVQGKGVASYSNSGVDLGATLGIGVELGEASEIVNTLKIEYYHPLMNVSKGIKTQGKVVSDDTTPTINEKQSLLYSSMFTNLGSIAITYSIGF